MSKVNKCASPVLLAVLSLIIVVLIFLMGVMAAVPPVSRDALTHHLAVPKLYIAHGGILEIPDLVASYFPMNLDLLYVLPLLIGNDIIPKYIHMAFGLLTALLIFRYLRRRQNALLGLCGVLLFISLPIIIQLFITVYVDLGLIFFSTASMLLVISWYENNLELKYLVLSALCCGLALGTKYNGLIVLLLITLAVPFFYAHHSKSLENRRSISFKWGRAAGYTVLFVVVSLMVFSPWALRNYFWTNNPLYPLYDVVFNPDNAFIERKLNPFAIRRILYNESIWQTLAVPLRIFFQGQDDAPAFFDGRLNPYLLILPIFGLTYNKQQSRQKIFDKLFFGIFAILFILIVFFTREMRIRYIAPAIPPLVILSAFGIENLYGRISALSTGFARTSKITVFVSILTILVSLNFVYLYKEWNWVNPIDYISGKVDRDTYILRYRPEYAAIKFTNENLNNHHRILCIFLGNRRYYFQNETVFFEWQQFKEFIEHAADEYDMAEKLKLMGITHIMMGIRGVEDWSPKTLDVNNQKKLIAFVEERLKTMIVINGYAVLKIL